MTWIQSAEVTMFSSNVFCSTDTFNGPARHHLDQPERNLLWNQSGMRSVAVGLHFANGCDRFWRVLHLAGFTARQLEPEEARLLLDYGCGIVSAVARPTASATDLSRADYVASRPVFERKIAKYRPRYLAFLGKPAVSVFLNRRDISWGLQPTKLIGSAVWVLPNPSGLNCAFTIGMLTEAYRELFQAAALPTVR
jgi:TDG/mug DNA glycosylase family protein